MTAALEDSSANSNVPIFTNVGYLKKGTQARSHNIHNAIRNQCKVHDVVTWSTVSTTPVHDLFGAND